MNEKLIYIGLAVFGILGPIAFPDYIMQFAVLWIMVIMATLGYHQAKWVTIHWEILHFGVGMYVSASIQVSMFYDLGAFTASYGTVSQCSLSRNVTLV